MESKAKYNYIRLPVYRIGKILLRAVINDAEIAPVCFARCAMRILRTNVYVKYARIDTQ